MVSSLTVMSGATIAPALPAMQAHFVGMEHAGLWIRLVLTVPALLIVLTAPLAGMIVDRWGRKYLLIPSIILYGIAGSSGIFLESLAGILLGRALLGVAVAGVMTSATTLISDYFTGPERARFMGWQAAFMSLGGVVFLIGGGVLAELGWRWPFMIYLMALLLVPLVLYSLPEPDRSAQASGINGGGMDDVVRESPMKLLSFLYMVGLIGMIVFYFVPLQIPFYLENHFEAGPAASGMAIAVSTLFGAVTALYYGKIRGRIGYVSILGFNFGLMGIGYMIISLAETYVLVLAGLSLCGLGMGLMFPNLNVWLASEVPSGMRGRAVGGLTTAVFLGQFISPLVSQPAGQWLGLKTMFLAAGFFLLIIAAAFMVLRKKILSFTEHLKEKQFVGLTNEALVSQSAGTSQSDVNIPHITDDRIKRKNRPS